MGERLEAVLAAIDAANAADPAREPDADAEAGGRPAALLYGLRMSAELARVAPSASEVLRIAARGQHVERWLVPRTRYPEGREGYLDWRRAQAARHAERIGAMMAAAGYPPEDCARAGALLRKEGLKRDPEVQTLEDVICLVFLRWYLADFAARHDPGAVLRILSKTARKMSAEGRARAAAELPIPPELAAALAV